MSTPKQYRKKSVVIKAMKWDGTAYGAMPIIRWIHREGGVAKFHEATPFKRHVEPDGTVKSQPAQKAMLVIDTREGPLFAFPGYAIIQGVEGEFYGCDPGIFDKTYEDVA